MGRLSTTECTYLPTQKAKLYKIEDKVVKINQAIHCDLRGLYFTYCLCSRLNSSKALSTSLRVLAILA